jgi:rhodanese-related sulfurtransferase
MNEGSSARAARMLSRAGVKNTCAVRGGLAAWEEANLPIERVPIDAES